MNERQEQRETFKATCAECGNETEVPFKPTEGRPVYCNDCFKNHRKPKKTFGRRFDSGRSSAPRKMHKATCAGCKKETEVPFKPTEGRPVYCRDCYMKNKQ